MGFTPLLQAWQRSRQERTPMHIGVWSARLEHELGGPMRFPSRTRNTARRERRTERRNDRADRRAATR